MSDGRSIRLPSANFAQVREPGRNGPAVTRFPRVGRGGSNPPLCTMCQRARIGIAACLRNRCLRVRISLLAPNFHLRSLSCALSSSESQHRVTSELPTIRKLMSISAFIVPNLPEADFWGEIVSGLPVTRAGIGLYVGL